MAVHPAMAEVLSSAVTDSVPSSASSSSSSSAAAAAAAAVADDLSKRVRKPYTITKSRESWTDQEHDKFIEALQLFDRDWKKIEAFVGTKTVIQIRSHAQKYFLKVQKNGTGQHVPPPRPKRKSAQPYPQKASKSAPVVQKVPLPVSQAEPNYTVAVQPATSVASVSSMSAWVHHMAPPANLGMMKKDAKPGSVPSGHSIDQMASNGPHQVMPISQGDRDVVLRVMPDFAEVYSFLGSVFDPTVHGHRERMDEMAPIDRETVLLLMRNLSINLSSGDFEEHKLFLSVYGMDSEAAMPPLDHNMGSKSTAPVSQPSLETGDGSLDSGICGFLQGADDRDEPQDIEEGKVMLESCANELADIPLECAFGEGNLESSKADMSCEDGLQNASLLEDCLLDTPGGSYSPETEENDKCRSRDSYEGEPSGGCKTEAIVDRWWS